MEETELLALGSITVLGIVAQWLAWRLRLPAILVLLLAGFLAGPATGLLRPDDLLGRLVFPFVSLSVAVILFEGGLGLRIRELRQTVRVVRNLVTLGALVTWLASAAAARWIIGVDAATAALVGAILVVTGPTVIGPLLRQVRPSGRTRSILMWEGIVIDPLGALLALLVFEVVFAESSSSAAAIVVVGLLKTVIAGGALGIAGALLLVFLLRRYWIPDYLQSPVALATCILAFCAANLIQDESGLLAVTVMGIGLANQRSVPIRHIVEFKENLGIVLISTLFVLLSARLDPQDFARLGPAGLAFVAALILLVRPLSVAVSALGSDLTWRERAFLAWVAPRGIVAAAVSSVFALRLTAGGHAEAHLLVPITFLVITGTVIVYGSTAGLAARALGIARARAQGVLFVGAHPWIRACAKLLDGHGLGVALVDTARENIAAARLLGLRAVPGSILSESVCDEIDLDGIGRLCALTPNDEVNALAALHFADEFGRAGVYQIAASGEARSAREASAPHLRGRLLFGREWTYDALERRWRDGAQLRATPLTEKFDFEAFRKRHGDRAIPLFLLTGNGGLQIFTADDPPVPRPGHVVVSLVSGEGDTHG